MNLKKTILVLLALGFSLMSTSCSDYNGSEPPGCGAQTSQQYASYTVRTAVSSSNRLMILVHRQRTTYWPPPFYYYWVVDTQNQWRAVTTADIRRWQAQGYLVKWGGELPVAGQK